MALGCTSNPTANLSQGLTVQLENTYPSDENQDPSVPSNPVCGITRGTLYFAREVIWRCKITERTLDKWIHNGLRVGRPGTKERFFLGDDVINHMFSHLESK